MWRSKKLKVMFSCLKIVIFREKFSPRTTLHSVHRIIWMASPPPAASSLHPPPPPLPSTCSLLHIPGDNTLSGSGFDSVAPFWTDYIFLEFILSWLCNFVLLQTFVWKLSLNNIDNDWMAHFLFIKTTEWNYFPAKFGSCCDGKCKKYKVFPWKPFILLNEQRIENGKINLSPISSLSITYLAEPFQYSSCGCGRRLLGLTHRYNNSPAPGLELSTKVREVSTVLS